MAQQVLQPELKKNGIQYQLRKLHVGDFLWIARPKFGGIYTFSYNIENCDASLDLHRLLVHTHTFNRCCYVMSITALLNKSAKALSPNFMGTPNQ